MRAWKSAAVCGVLLVFSGCAGAETVSESPAPSDGSAGPTTTAGAPPVPSGAPVRSVGQWWTWKVESGTSATFEVTTGVARNASGAHVVGATDLALAFRSYAFHLVPLGVVRDADLAWQAHGLPMELVRFPLTDGASWSSDSFLGAGNSVKLTAAKVQGPAGEEEGFVSEVSYPGGGVALRAQWSTAREQFVRLETLFGGESPFASASLVDQGSQSSQALAAFEAREIVRFTAAVDPARPDATAPRPFSPRSEDEQLLFVCWAGGAPGAYGARLVAPDGSEAASCLQQNGPTETAFPLTTSAAKSAGGTWNVVYSVGGPGRVVSEVFGVRAL